MILVAATWWKAHTSWPVGTMKEGGRAQPVVPVSLVGGRESSVFRKDVHFTTTNQNGGLTVVQNHVRDSDIADALLCHKDTTKKKRVFYLSFLMSLWHN